MKTIILILPVWRIKKLMYDFAKEINFDKRAPGNKSNRDKSLIKVLS